ncbi:MAG: sulfotransferase domain-containing protein [Terrimicrobiaceae bacterium]|nr:sulfotransferase domain-containing protein [Terrimicrobiaceae bacterium]
MKIVIASFGRCGSTLVAEAVHQAFPELPYCFERYVKDFPEEGVIKTHCLAPLELEPGVKYLYCYRSPLLSVISAHSQPEDFQQLHYANLGADIANRGHWPRVDVLNLKGNYLSWRLHQGKVFFLRYADIWEQKRKLADYLDREIPIPAPTPRETVFDKNNPSHLQACLTYENSWL